MLLNQKNVLKYESGCSPLRESPSRLSKHLAHQADDIRSQGTPNLSVSQDKACLSPYRRAQLGGAAEVNILQPGAAQGQLLDAEHAQVQLLNNRQVEAERSQCNAHRDRKEGQAVAAYRAGGLQEHQVGRDTSGAGSTAHRAVHLAMTSKGAYRDWL